MTDTWSRTWTVFIVLAVGILVAGCAQSVDRATPSPGPTDTAIGPSPTPSPDIAPTEVEPSATPAPSVTPTQVELSPTPSPDAVVAVSPTSGPPGSEVQVTGAGFSPETEIELGMGRKDSEYDVVATSDTDAEGSLTTSMAIPTWAEPGEEWMVVASTMGGAAKGVSNVFQVTQPQYQPTVAISPQSGPAGTNVAVAARGFPPNAAVSIGVGRVNSEYDVVATAQTDADGRVDTRITIPAFVEPGDRWVIVIAAQDRPIKAISKEFDVTSAPTPSGNLFTRTNIYLIAVGDDGQSGKEIGCDDSVVPVEVAIEPTIAPLTAALNKLLSLKTREYGQSGLYNALHGSDLTVQDINIVSREALIRLSGTLTLGGVCDEPRVRAQIEETALQYTTVDRVSIFVNGTPLEALLGEK